MKQQSQPQNRITMSPIKDMVHHPSLERLTSPMARQRRKSLYMHTNAPLRVSEVTETTVRSSQESTLHDENQEVSTVHNRNTVMIQQSIGEKASPPNMVYGHSPNCIQKVENTLFQPQKPMANLDDLSNFLYTRGRLQEMGCTFTPLGELISYGAPGWRDMFDDMLRLGPIYDEQWKMFFVNGESQSANECDGMWSDLKTLKKMLVNDGVTFGLEHRRITHGDMSERTIRLCNAYDDLRKIWVASISLHVPARIEEQSEGESSVSDTGFVEDTDSDGDMGHAWASEQRASIRSSVPRNLGWRFSDDVDPEVVPKYRDSINDGTYEELEEALEVAMSVPLPVVLEDLRLPPSPVQPATVVRHLPSLDALVGTPRPTGPVLLHGSSPLHSNTTPDMLLRDELAANPRGDNLDIRGLDIAIAAIMALNPSGRSAAGEAPAKKKGFKGWLRGVFGRK
jgi:hypothetical protein